MSELKEQQSFLKWVVIVGLGILLLAAIGGGGRYVYLQTWGVRTADMERAVFEESKSYVQGTIRDLDNLRIQYYKTDNPTERAVLRETMRHRLVAFPDDKVPDHLKEFVAELRGGGIK